jgi:Cof subfamily protein (haloacid dehalogenase superfamily)
LTDARFTVAASDLDDTLLQPDGSISPRTEQAIRSWLNAGRRFVVATGRPPRGIGERLPPFLHHVPWICYNGAEIRLHGEVIYRHFIPEATLVELVELILSDFPDTIIGIEIEDLLWLNKPRTPDKLNPHHRVADLREVAHLPTAKVLLFSERLDALLEGLGPMPDAVRLMPSGRYPFVQLMAEGADKVTALRHLLEGWGESLENLVAFGDDINDVEMLQAAGLGVAVANAFPGALAVARRIAPANTEDGVAQVMEELMNVND